MEDDAAGDVPEFETFAVVQDEAEQPAEVSYEFETNAVDPFETNNADAFGTNVSEAFETNAASGPTFSDPTASFADLNDDVATVDVAGEASPDDGSRMETMMRQELESVDFYIAQGYSDIAVDTLEMLERQFGSHPDIKARREKLAAAGGQPVAETPAVFEFGGVEELPVARVEEATFGEEAAYAALAGEPEVREQPVAPLPPVAPVGAPVASGIDAGLAELFEEFRAAEEGDDVREDYETHYNMGTAYKEMDLIDEAIQEFQTAAGLVKPGDGTSRFLQCCNLLGHCFVQKGMPEAAVIWFKKGLSAPGHSEDEYQALRYELGTAYEQLGDLKQAREFYTEVYGVDVSYREVADKLSQLKGK
jgi:tetratricopeptide (TPR) repeat protein